MQAPPANPDSPRASPPAPPLVVLLRGVGREAAHWGEFPDRLRRALAAGGGAASAVGAAGPTGGPDLVCLDLPGAGARHREPVPATVPGIADGVRAELLARAPGARPLIVGLSLGGMLALHWALAHPGEVRGLVLVNSSAGSLSPFWRRARPRTWPTLLAIKLARSVAARERRILALSSNRYRDDAGVLAAWLDVQRARPVGPATAARHLLAAARYRPALPAAPGALPPALVLTSRGDRLVDPACSRRLAAALHAPIQEHPDAGHDLMLDDPDWVAQQIRAWSGWTR